MPRLALMVEDEVKARLDSLAAARDHSSSALMRRALVEFLDREERCQHELAEDEERWSRWLAGDQAIDHADVAAWLDGVARGHGQA